MAATIIAGFPCIGKTYLATNYRQHVKGGVACDLDSSTYNKDKKAEWVQKYVEDIKKTADHLGPSGIVLVSCHRAVRIQMKATGLNYIRVYPNPQLKKKWLVRQKARAKAKDGLWEAMNKHWVEWMEIDDGFDKRSSDEVVLGGGEYLTDRIDEMMGRSAAKPVQGPVPATSINSKQTGHLAGHP